MAGGICSISIPVKWQGNAFLKTGKPELLLGIYNNARLLAGTCHALPQALYTQ